MQTGTNHNILGSEVWCWGDGKYGQLGSGHKKNKKIPFLLKPLRNLGVVQLSCGGRHCSAVTASGHLYVWGNGSSGCLGRGDLITLTLPRRVILEETRVLQVACGSNHTCFLSFEGIYYSTGNNDYGQLGFGNTISTCVPQVVSTLKDVKIHKIICGPNQSACIDIDGNLFCWGDARNGQTCHNVRFNELLPKRVEYFNTENHKINEVCFGEDFGCCITTDGEAFYWGYLLKTNFGKVNSLTPTKIESPTNECSFKCICCGESSITLLNSNGEVYTLGLGLNGQLGNGNKENKYSPQLVVLNKSADDNNNISSSNNNNNKIIQIASGKNHVMVLAENGLLYSWGSNQRFQLGVSQTARKEFTSPTQVLAFQNHMILQLIASWNTSAALVLPLESNRIATGNNFADSLPRIISIDLSREENLTVFIGTWNVNAKIASNISSWITSPIPPDIIAIGLQEMIELTSQSLAKDQINNLTKEDTNSNRWVNLFETTLSTTYSGISYVLLSQVKLAGIFLCIFINKKWKKMVRDCKKSTVAVGVNTGVLGKLGNKGAVGVRFAIEENTFCFVNCHLAAGQNNIEKRNLDYKYIASNMKFDLHKDKRQYSTIFDHQTIFWFGDMNYRIKLTKSSIENLVDQKDYKNLFKFDQLAREVSLKQVFQGFTEPSINFPPSYKFDIGTSIFDTSEKMRRPSWCDRIFYRGKNIRCYLYSSCMNLECSDHKPVYSVFNVCIKLRSNNRSSKYFRFKNINLERNDNISTSLPPTWKKITSSSSTSIGNIKRNIINTNNNKFQNIVNNNNNVNNNINSDSSNNNHQSHAQHNVLILNQHLLKENSNSSLVIASPRQIRHNLNFNYNNNNNNSNNDNNDNNDNDNNDDNEINNGKSDMGIEENKWNGEEEEEEDGSEDEIDVSRKQKSPNRIRSHHNSSPNIISSLIVNNNNSVDHHFDDQNEVNLGEERSEVNNVNNNNNNNMNINMNIESNNNNENVNCDDDDDNNNKLKKSITTSFIVTSGATSLRSSSNRDMNSKEKMSIILFKKPVRKERAREIIHAYDSDDSDNSNDDDDDDDDDLLSDDQFSTNYAYYEEMNDDESSSSEDEDEDEDEENGPFRLPSIDEIHTPPPSPPPRRFTFIPQNSSPILKRNQFLAAKYRSDSKT